MADITKCTNNECFLAEDCYRISAPDTPNAQYYQDFKPNFDNHGWFCDDFKPNKPKEE